MLHSTLGFEVVNTQLPSVPLKCPPISQIVFHLSCPTEYPCRRVTVHMLPGQVTRFSCPIARKCPPNFFQHGWQLCTSVPYIDPDYELFLVASFWSVKYTIGSILLYLLNKVLWELALSPLANFTCPLLSKEKFLFRRFPMPGFSNYIAHNIRFSASWL